MLVHHLREVLVGLVEHSHWIVTQTLGDVPVNDMVKTPEPSIGRTARVLLAPLTTPMSARPNAVAVAAVRQVWPRWHPWLGLSSG